LVLIAFLASFTGTGMAGEAEIPTFTSHVTDPAGVLGAGGAGLERKLRAFEAATGNQVAVLIVATTGTRSIEEYAVEVFERWKLGRAGIDDGVLFVISMADRPLVRRRGQLRTGREVWRRRSIGRMVRQDSANPSAQRHPR
jgi:uncharacterized protein